jgi:RNA methyltransferase, TrmH family
MSEIPVTSRDNPVFKRLLKLAESSRARREARMSLLDGEHLLTAYLDAGGEPHTLVRAASLRRGTARRPGGTLPPGPQPGAA